MKKITVWLIAISVFTVDFITTILALNVFPAGMFYEANPIGAWFFSFGFWGWVLNYLFMLTVMFFTVQFVFWIKKFDKKRGHTNFHLKVFLVTIFLLDGWAIQNNIRLMLGAL